MFRYEINNNIILCDPNEVGHICPFNKFADTFLVEINVTNTLSHYWSADNKWLFNIDPNKFETCKCEGSNRILYKTTEGAFIYIKNSAVDKFPCTKQTKDYNSMIELVIAGEDFDKMKNFNEKQELNYNICANLKAQINMFKFFNNQIFLINNIDNELIVYVRNNIMYTPKCFIIKDIEVISESNLCFKDIPIKFTKDNKIIFGFLTSNRIIRLTSENITCNGLQSIIFLSNNMALEYIDNKVKLVDTRKSTSQISHLKMHNINEPNFQHSSLITDGLDIIHDPNIIEITDKSGFTFSIKGKKDSSYNMSQNFVALETAFLNTKNKVYTDFISLTFIIIGLIISLSLMFLCCYFAFRNNWYCISYNYIRNKIKNSPVTSDIELEATSSLKNSTSRREIVDENEIISTSLSQNQPLNVLTIESSLFNINSSHEPEYTPGQLEGREILNRDTKTLCVNKIIFFILINFALNFARFYINNLHG